MERLAKTDKELSELSKNRKEIMRSLHSSKHSVNLGVNDNGDDDSMSGHSFGDESDNDDDSALDKMERNASSKGSPINIKGQRNQKMRITRATSAESMHAFSGHSGGSSSFGSSHGKLGRGFSSDHESLASLSNSMSHLGERREMRLLRERRVLREKEKTDALELRTHLIGTLYNITLIIITLILIIAIARTGGLCVYDNRVKIFSNDQLQNCNRCVGATDTCQQCNVDGTGSDQCYYPYY
jgi:hypothetical protein